MADRYPVSKSEHLHCLPHFVKLIIPIVLNIFFTRSLANHLPITSPLIVDCVSPGLTRSNVMRNTPLLLIPFIKLFVAIFARKTTDGAKTYVWAALAGKPEHEAALRQELRGAFSMDCTTREPSDYMMSKEGRDAEALLWVRGMPGSRLYNGAIKVANFYFNRTRLWTSYRRQTLACKTSFPPS
jgi:hypothetical protein